ncbi:hypothetical protein AB1278_00035 [Chryseobacterium sp. NRRL B-14798]|uniref:hypothetical protein n=1 Tax=Chryseobacterium sp. NRRL B-14798 TaxID=3162880 RepID=UPI003D1AE7E6
MKTFHFEKWEIMVSGKIRNKKDKREEFKAVDTSPSQIYTPPDTDYNVKIKLLEKDNYGILFNQNVIHNPLEILEKTKEKFNIQGVVIPNQKHFDIYIIYKIISICFKYESYRKFVVNKNIDNHSVKFVNILDFLDYIEEYPSHIAYKLKQTVNFIKYYSILWNDMGLILKLILMLYLKN